MKKYVILADVTCDISEEIRQSFGVEEYIPYATEAYTKIKNEAFSEGHRHLFLYTKPKNELIRVVRSPEGEISLDLKGKASGRGAYICNDLECLRKARKSRRIDRTFEITIPEAVYDSLEEQIKKDDNR